MGAGWGAGCASTPSPPPAAPLDAAAVAERRAHRLAELQTAPLGQLPRAASRAVLRALPAGELQPALERELGIAESEDALASFRLVGPRDDHPALDLVFARATALTGEGVDGAVLGLASLSDARSRVSRLREALAAANTPEAAEAARTDLLGAATEAEVLGWRLSLLLARELGGPIADEPFLGTWANRLLEAPIDVLAQLEPADPAYVVVAQGLMQYRRYAQAAAADDAPRGPVIEPSRSWRRLRPGKRDHKRIPALRRRLALEGFGAPPVEGKDPAVFDEPLLQAIIHFQRRHGLRDAGRLDKATLAALSVPLSERVAQLEAVLAHMRSHPSRAERTRFVVNIPAFQLKVYREGRLDSLRRVVVGSTAYAYDPANNRRGRLNHTPVMKSEISQLVLNPSWRVPRRIKEEEIDVIATRRPEIYDRYELYTDSRGVEWAVQPPGPYNALGRVKFVFPGGDGVFLHDTPKKKGFNERRRALSHGCVRVQDAIGLARTILEWDPQAMNWNLAARILNSRHETPVTLSQPIPIVIEYVTAGATEEGELSFFPDLYGLGVVKAP